jgi:hypothetical protein
MGRRSNNPFVFDELKIVSIADLKRYGYLRDGYRYGTLSWSCRGRKTGEVRIAAQVWADRGYLEFRYTYDLEKYFQYQVPLVAIPTNLGMGQRWYFLCPRTGRRCAKLHMANDYFQHRSGIPGGLYNSQTRSGLYRMLDRFWRAQDQIYTPYLKTHYRGRPTKRYLRYYRAYTQTEA